MIMAETQLFEKDGKYFLKAIGLTTDYVNVIELEALNKYAVNQNLIYRHFHPTEYDGSDIIGTIIESAIVDYEEDGLSKKRIEWLAELLFYTEFQKQAIGYMLLKQEEGESIEVSVGKQAFVNEEFEVIDSRPFEWSITPYAYCKECTTVISKMESPEQIKIKELEVALNNSISKISEKDSVIAKLEAELKAKPTVTADNSKLEDAIKAVSAKYEEQIAKRDTEFASLNSKFESLQAENEERKREPFYSVIKKWSNDEWMFDNVYKVLPMDKLQETAKKAEEAMAKQAKVAPVVSHFENERKAAEAKAKSHVDKFEGLDATLKKILNDEPITAEERAAYLGGN